MPMLRFPRFWMLHQRLERARGGASGAQLESALGVAAHRVFNLDHVGTPVGEHGASRWCEGELRHFEDRDAFHWSRHGRGRHTYRELSKIG